MSITNILSAGSEQHASQQKLPSRPLARPSLLQNRVYSSQPDPWDYPFTVRSNSTYSVYSNVSAQSTSSLESTQLPQLRNPGLERSDSSDSCQSGPISPVTPVDSTDSSAQTNTLMSNNARLEELAAGAALTSMRTQLPCLSLPLQPTYAASQYMQMPNSPTLSARRSQSPRAPHAPRDVNGNRLYPCPLAATYRCDQHFSTSGHARRHSRIHTGERGAECPECGQKFSRQDNMQQHRRTHRNGRDGRRAGLDMHGAPIVKSTIKGERRAVPLN
jgi:hypothetical protein